MEVVVERLGRHKEGDLIKAHRNNYAKRIIAMRGGRKLLPSDGGEHEPRGPVAMSPTFGLPRQMKRSG